MVSIEWFSPSQYQYAEHLSAPEYAWEYLRRHDEYQRDFRRMKRAGIRAAGQTAEFSRRWGLRFPVRS